jgi:ribosomal protein S18 acetylase RimI-like enzyme
MALRPATGDDRSAILALGVAEEAAWFGEAEASADEVGEWVDDEGGLDEGVVSVDDAGRSRGFVSPGRHAAVLLADPAVVAEAADELVSWLREQRETFELMAFAGDRERVVVLERHGLGHRRSVFSMLRPAAAGPLPEATFPEGYDVAPYRFGDDDEAVHRLIYTDAAWASVPGHAERDLRSWREAERSCTSLFLARREGRPAGWVTGRLLDNGRGYVSMLAVAGSERGRGLGRALLLHGLSDLERAGARDLALGVQAQNDAALELYRSVGLEVEREWRTYATASEGDGA